MRTTEHLTMHFELGHCPPNNQFTLVAASGKRFKLTAYKDAPGKMNEHRKTNKALALIPQAQLDRITHFVEGAEMPADKVCINRVEYPPIGDHPLPEIAIAFIHIPTQHKKTAIRHYPSQNKSIPHHIALEHYGVMAGSVNNADIEDVHLAADDIKTPAETARTLIFNHPEIGTVDPRISKYVFDHYVNKKSTFQDLITYIQNHPPESNTPWYNQKYATWINPDTKKEEPIPANMDLKYADDVQPDWPIVNGQPQIPMYDLSDQYSANDTGVCGAAAPAVQQVLKATKNDLVLNGQLWAKQDGTTQKSFTDVPPTAKESPRSFASKSQPARSMEAGAEDSTKGFALKNTTSSYGLYLYDDELTYNYSDKTLSFPVKNWPARYLGLYVEFFKEDGTPIKRSEIPGWEDSMPEFLRSMFEISETKNYLDWVSSGNMIFGVPVPPLTNKTDVTFKWPQAASKAVVYLGGLGVAEGFKDWDTAVDVVGVLGTGIACYGVSVLSLSFTVYIANPFMWGLKGDAKFGFYAVCGVIGVSALCIGALEYKTSMGKYILSKLASMAVSIIFGIAVQKILEQAFKKAIEAIIAETVAEITTQEALSQIPYAGWALKIASIAADVAAITATTVECVLSPATYKLELLHTLDLTVTVKPDPTHGKPGEEAIWPMVADHYVIQVKYPKGNNQDGGTTFTMAGPMPGSKTAPIVVTFQHIPAGGKIDVMASIYSDTNWIAGAWESGWINADPDINDQLSIGGNIKENLVPLTADTIYSQKQCVVYNDTQKHFWQITKFTISDEFIPTLDNKVVSPDLKKAFADNGNNLSDKTSVIVVTLGQEWNLIDAYYGVTYNIVKKLIYNSDGQSKYELSVQNKTNEYPKIPDVTEDCGSEGHRMCERMDITINNFEYQLGYAWRASGQNMPRDYGTTPDNGQMYTMQAISTLGQPQDYIIEPSRGFSNPTYIAFDQFGLMSLFDMNPDTYMTELNKGGPVPNDIKTEFAKYQQPIPDGSIITVRITSRAWDIGLPNQDPLYSLRYKTVIKDGAFVNVINVYSYPVPSVDNFYLDSRTYTPTNKLYYLRGITFAKGQSTFDYDSKKSWGCFMNVTLKALAVHPQGYIVAADYDNHKLLTLRLPAEAVDDANAPIAMPLSGEGLREGLMNKPVALTITADGRILILEEGNQRVQAFDVKGNPVPCFNVGQTPFELNAKFITDLDNRVASTALIQAFQVAVKPTLAVLFLSSTSSVAALNNGIVDQTLTNAFVDKGYAKNPQTPPTFDVIITQKDKLWLLQDKNSSALYDVRVLTDSYNVSSIYVFNAFALSIFVKSKGVNWTINDTTNAATYDVTKPIDKINLVSQPLVSFMPLRAQGTSGITYLDIAAETKGYIYVLSKFSTGGTPEYRLDIYEPTGQPLNKTQAGVNVAKLTVDQWRSMWTLNFDKFLGPGGRTEPGVSGWIPSTPEGPTSTLKK